MESGTPEPAHDRLRQRRRGFSNASGASITESRSRNLAPRMARERSRLFLPAADATRADFDPETLPPTTKLDPSRARFATAGGRQQRQPRCPRETRYSCQNRTRFATDRDVSRRCSAGHSRGFPRADRRSSIASRTSAGAERQRCRSSTSDSLVISPARSTIAIPSEHSPTAKTPPPLPMRTGADAPPPVPAPDAAA